MGISKRTLAVPLKENAWRYAILVGVVAGSLLGILSLPPIAQDIAYHAFADTRTFLGVPNFLDVLSNLPFLIVGIAGLSFCAGKKDGAIRSAWMVLFAGVGLVSFGSAYYHWNPDNDSLVWDRLPMAIGFMGLFVALLGEYLGKQMATLLLYPAVLLGLATVVYWHFSDDLRPYLWVQLVPLITIPTIMILFPSQYSHQWLLLVGLGWYLLAKLTEFYDVAIYQGTQEWLSGHSIKHLLAAAGSYSILVMLQRRKPRLATQGRSD